VTAGANLSPALERTDQNRASAGTRIGERYELVRPIARGGMGQVWVGRHWGLDRLVAVKLLEKTAADQEGSMLAEARTLAKLRHPNVVEVFDCGTDVSGIPFVVMELLDGPTLAAYVESHGALGAVAATRLLLPMLDGLSAVHAAGVVHRDLKPENVVLVPLAGQPSPKLIDFGIARAQAEPTGQTSSGGFFGTPQYMSPEQIHGARGDVRSDVWAATTVLYEAIAGRPAFVGDDVEGLFHAIVYDPPAFPAHVRDLDGKLWTILMRGLRKVPAERYESCAALADALRAWSSQPGKGDGRPPPLIRAASPAVSSSPDAATLSAVQLRPAGLMGPLDELMRKKEPRG
jgi:serine/threonine protein kinase